MAKERRLTSEKPSNCSMLHSTVGAGHDSQPTLQDYFQDFHVSAGAAAAAETETTARPRISQNISLANLNKQRLAHFAD